MASARRTTATKPSSTKEQISKVSRPSDRLNPKTVNPFGGSEKKKTAFAAVYENGGIPCRLVHGSVKHKLTWDTPPEYVAYDPVLCTLAEGLRETVHPYAFVARMGFKELLATEGAGEKTLPVLASVSASIRAALISSDHTVFEAGIDALEQVSNAVGPALNQYLKNMLAPISKKISDKKFRDTVTEKLHTLEQNGGKDALLLIKTKIPTYSSIHM